MPLGRTTEKPEDEILLGSPVPSLYSQNWSEPHTSRRVHKLDAVQANAGPGQHIVLI